MIDSWTIFIRDVSFLVATNFAVTLPLLFYTDVSGWGACLAGVTVMSAMVFVLSYVRDTTPTYDPYQSRP